VAIGWGSRDSASPIGVFRASHWLRPAGRLGLLSDFALSSSLTAPLYPGSSGSGSAPLPTPFPDDLGFVPNPGSMSVPPVTNVLCVCCKLYS